MSPFFVFLVFSVTTVAVFGFHDGRMMEALLFREQRDVSPSINCATKNFELVAKCCRKPVGDLFGKSVVQDCNKIPADEDLTGFLKEYKLHRFQDFSQSNAIVLNVNSTLKYFGPAACLTDCAFRNQSLIYDNGTINFDSVSSNFVAMVPDTWKNIVGNIVRNCSEIVEGSTVSNITVQSTPPVTCLLQPALLIQCIRMHIILNCPSQQASTTKSCQTGVSNVESCDPFKQD